MRRGKFAVEDPAETGRTEPQTEVGVRMPANAEMRGRDADTQQLVPTNRHVAEPQPFEHGELP